MTYGTADLLRNTAVVDVAATSTPDPNQPTLAKAVVVSPNNGSGPNSQTNPDIVALSWAQDPQFDTANGVQTTISNASATLITPPANCRYLRISTTQDVWINTDGNAASASNGQSVIVRANTTETIPVPNQNGSTAIKAIRGTTTDAVVTVMPYKARTV